MKNKIIAGAIIVCLIAVGGYVFNKLWIKSPQPDVLVITQENPQHRPIPSIGTTTIKDPDVVQELYSDILAMPSFPNGPIACPADFGVSYDLTFSSGKALILKAKAEATGCKGIRLSNGKSKWSMGKEGDNFWSTLGKALRLSDKELSGVTPH